MSQADRCPKCGSTLPDEAPAAACTPEAGFDATPGPSGPGVLDSLAATVGPVPRVLLREADDGADDPTAVRAASPEMPAPGAGPGCLVFMGEIARGGMGAVLKGRDMDLGRDLAVKVLLERHQGDADLVRRFVEEAQIAGQLQHPGIVPVYELGAFADSRPYFSMKLVKGRTLAEMLAARESPASDLPRLLGIFQQVAQTVAYAHARGVIHRDLKPSNVMVGAFGEVQVMDWGLAKVLPRGGAAEGPPEAAPRHETVIATARSREADSELSVAGSVLGTPAYMAPEQARGETDRVDERADVFGLGAILCEVLTGRPAFLGRSSGEIQRNAALGDTADALARLGSCGADGEVAAIAAGCLAREPEDRPRDASVVADQMTAHLAGVQDRLRRSELARVEAETRSIEEEKRRVLSDRLAVEERRKRRATIALAASILLTVGVAAGGWAWIERGRAARRVAVLNAMAEARAIRDQARDDPPSETRRWDAAMASATQAERLLVGVGDRALGAQVADLRERIASERGEAVAGRDLLADLGRIRQVPNRTYQADSEASYFQAFRRAGRDIDRDAPRAFAAWVKAHRSAADLIAYLDDWATWATGPARAGRRRRILEVIRAADADPWRTALRSALNKKDRPELHRLADDEASLKGQPLPSLRLLGFGLRMLKEYDRAERVLLLAWRREPGDYLLNLQLYITYAVRPKPDAPNAMRFAGVLVAMAPSDGVARLNFAANLLTVSLDPKTGALDRGKVDEAVEHLRVAMEDRTNSPSLRGACHSLLAQAYAVTGRPDDAIQEARRSIELDESNYLAHSAIADILAHRGKLDEAVAQYRIGLRLNAQRPDVRAFVIQELERVGRIEAVIAELSDLAAAHPGTASLWGDLGAAYLRQGKYEDSARASRRALEIDPGLPSAIDYLADALRAMKGPEAVLGLYRDAVAKEPNSAQAHAALGNVLRKAGRMDEAILSAKEAVRLDPDFTWGHQTLAWCYLGKKDWDRAIAEYGRAIALTPDDPVTHFELAESLRGAERLDEAIVEFRRAESLAPEGSDDSTRADREATATTRRRNLLKRLPEVLAGRDRPASTKDRIDLAYLCMDRRLGVPSARLFSEAFEADPSLADIRAYVYRYDAACMAGLAGAGRSLDRPPPDDAEKARLRGRALAWLRGALDTWSEVARSGEPKAREDAARFLRHWKGDPDLIGVRDAPELAKLPESEREAWRAFWADVDALLAMVKS